MSSTALSVRESSTIGEAYSVGTSTNRGTVVAGEFFAGRPLALPNSRAVTDLIADYERDDSRRAAMQAARAQLANTLYANRPGGLAALRLSRGFSQSALASAAGTSQAHVARIEAGRNDPGTSLIARLAAVLGADEIDVFKAVRADQSSAGDGQ
jgi:DNA-binding XRE family transcriptional regulator